MSFGFTEIINSIESEISFQYLPGAIRWADENHDGAWSKAIDRFDRALSLAIERMDYNSLKIEGAQYKRTVLDLISKYKQVKKISDVSSYLDSLGSQSELNLKAEVA